MIPADLCLATVIVQLSIVQESGAWRVRGFMLSGDECAQFLTQRSAFNADAIRRALARGIGCEPLVISIVLPSGERLPVGKKGDAVLLQWAKTFESNDKAKKRKLKAPVDQTPQKKNGSGEEDEKSNDSRVADGEKVHEENDNEKEKAAQCSSAASQVARFC